MAQIVKNLPTLQNLGLIPGSGRSPKEGHATHCSSLAWRISWTEESGGLQSMGCKVTDTTEFLTFSLLCYIRILQYIFQSGKYYKTLNDQHGYLMYKNMNTEA